MSWLNLLPTEKLIQTLGIHLAIHYCWRRPEMHTSSSSILSWRFTAISFHCHSNAKDFRYLGSHSGGVRCRNGLCTVGSSVVYVVLHPGISHRYLATCEVCLVGVAWFDRVAGHCDSLPWINDEFTCACMVEIPTSNLCLCVVPRCPLVHLVHALAGRSSVCCIHIREEHLYL